MDITVERIFMACAHEMAKGNKDKKILISDDNEGNGFHELCYLFSPVDKYIKEIASDFNGDIDKDFVVLG